MNTFFKQATADALVKEDGVGWSLQIASKLFAFQPDGAFRAATYDFFFTSVKRSVTSDFA